MLSYLKLCDECASVALSGRTAAGLTDAVPSPFVSLWSREPNAVNAELLMFPLSAFPVKRSREAHEAHESGTESQKKRQKEEKKPEHDASSLSTRFQTENPFRVYFALCTWPALQHHIWAKSMAKIRKDLLRRSHMLVANHFFLHFNFEWHPQPEPAAFLCWKRLEAQESTPFLYSYQSVPFRSSSN